jgi:hypothetical protein
MGSGEWGVGGGFIHRTGTVNARSGDGVSDKIKATRAERPSMGVFQSSVTPCLTLATVSIV